MMELALASWETIRRRGAMIVDGKCSPAECDVLDDVVSCCGRTSNPPCRSDFQLERLERVENWHLRADRIRIAALTYPDTSEIHNRAPARTGHWRLSVEPKMNIMSKNLDLA